MLGAINAMAAVLAVRLIALVTVGGAIGLLVLALGNPTLDRQILVGIYCLLVVCPVIWLATREK